ncbi:MAG TPA: bifunctional adenosylcobinamide kinase/adenosylcobinamide-phosphate guanylyltransferase [Propionibacteriaceae bacterium]|jgi:adenosylcobinamide kinase/adenosylcobinamide-phosphate guanylyltransferase|nr:bifunctional adenosylcobinamide kinase/adenosylcobinamide-phosphate guanylyltransferase [Propionibacteriaceae bacterium]
MASRRILVTGGTRSGKSGYAERLLADQAAVTFLAPGPPADPTTDPEWAGRIALHQARRPAHWTTVETGDLPGALRAAAGEAVMIDSLGSWLTAVLDRLEAWSAPAEAWSDAVADQVTDLVDAWRSCRRTAVAVTDEVGLGLVSEHRSGRIFADHLGGLNQAVAEASDEVILMVAGRALPL